MEKYTRLRSQIKDHTLILYTALALFQLLFMFYQCGKQSMWLDEMSFLGTITKDKSLKDILWQYIAVDVTNLPLFPLIASLWYRIVPANDRMLLLLPEFFAAAALPVTAMLAERNFGKKSGVLAAILMLISQRPIINCGFELRAYGLMLFLAAMTLLLFFERKREISRKNQILYFISMLLLIYTHYSGAILIFILGLSDLIRAVGKKSIRILLPYLFSGILFLPWFLLMIRFKKKSIGSFWVDPPTIPEIARTYKYLLSGNEFIFIIFLLGIFIMFFRLFVKTVNKERTGIEESSFSEMVIISFLMVAGIFIYSTVINPGGGFFLNRYFIVLVPLIISSAAFSVFLITEYLFEGQRTKKKDGAFFVAAAFILIYFGFINLSEIRHTSGTSWETFREAARYIVDRGILEDDGNAALVCSVNERATAGFSEYYVRKGGKERELKHISLQGEDPVSEISKYDRLYLVYVHRDLEDLDPEIMRLLNREYVIVDEDQHVKAAVYERRKPR